MGAEPKPISVDLGGPLFADGNAAHVSIACLPLAEGYQATYRNFDVQKQKPALKQAKVTGAEEVKVAAGTFQAWKVELTSAEGDPGPTTLWVDKATRQGREDVDDAAPDGRRGRHVRAPALVV